MQVEIGEIDPRGKLSLVPVIEGDQGAPVESGAPDVTGVDAPADA